MSTMRLAAVLAGLLLGATQARGGWPLLGSKPHGGSSSTLHVLDRATGADTLTGPYVPGVVAMNGLAYDAMHGILYGISPHTDRLYTIDPVTAQVGPVGQPGDLGFGNANGLAYDPTAGVLYGTDNFTNTLFTIDPGTGLGSPVGTIGGGFSNVEGLGFDPRTRTLYGLADGTGGSEVFYYGQIVLIDVATGDATPLGDPLPSERIWRGLTFDPLTEGLIACGGSGLYRIDLDDGAATYIGGTYVQGLAVIPEPATLALLAVGVGAVWMKRRRNK